MPRVPAFVPSVDPQVGGMVPLQAQQTREIQNFAPQQMQEAGRAVQQLGGVVSDYAMRVQNEVDSANIKRHDNILADEIERIMRDPKSGYLNQVGKVAVDNRQAAFDALAKKQKDIEKGLQNPLQRQIWGENAQKRIRQATSDANEHYTKQAKVWEIGESQVRGSNFVRDMERNATRTDPEGVAAYSVAKKGLLGEADRISELSGHPIGSAQYNETRLQATTNAHSTIIRGMADQNPQKAQEHLDAASAAGEIAPEVAADLKKLVQGATENDQAQQLASSPEIAGKSLQEKVDHIQSLYAAKDGIPVGVRDNAIARILDDHRIANIAKAESDTEMRGKWQTWLNANPDKMPARVDDAELKKWANENGEWDWINGYARNGRVVNNPEVQSMLLKTYLEEPDLFASGNDAVFKMSYAPYLEPDELRYFQALRNQVREAATPEDVGILERREVVKMAAQELQYINSNGTPLTTDGGKKYHNLLKFVHNAVAAEETDKRRKLTTSEVMVIVNNIQSDKVRIDDAMTDTEALLIDVPAGTDPATIYVPTKNGELYVNRIPPEEIENIRRDLVDEGMPVNLSMIAWMYNDRGRPGYLPEGAPIPSATFGPKPETPYEKALRDAAADEARVNKTGRNWADSASRYR